MKKFNWLLIILILATQGCGRHEGTTVEDDFDVEHEGTEQMVQTEDGSWVPLSFYGFEGELTDEAIAEMEMNGGPKNYFSQR